MSNLLSEMKGRNITWALQRASLAENFDRVLVLSGGQVVEDGSFQDLVKKKTALSMICCGRNKVTHLVPGGLI